MPINRASSVIPPRVLLKDVVYDTLREAIVAGELAPGQALTESDLIARYGGTRASIKDAVRRLALDGLAVVRPQAVSTVAPVSPTRIRQAWSVYRALIVNAVADATPALTDEDIRRLRDTATRWAAATSAGDGFAAADAFYSVFSDRLGNKVMQSFRRKATAETARAFNLLDLPGYRPSAVTPDIIAAAEARDGVTAARLVGEQLEVGTRALPPVDGEGAL
jgi:DNA-binding GntR family transcriptional regulator